MQLSPNSAIPVSYTASIPGDTTTYFVQAVLRDTQSSATLQTLNLTQVSTTPNRYTGDFSPVSDASGLGRPVDITVTVYTDSAHTIPSNNYQILQINYVILQPWIQNLGTGGGMNIDYVKLQAMFDGAKVGNAEIGNEKVPKTKRERINYRRLEEAAMGSSEATRGALSEELKGHVKSISGAIEQLSKSYMSMGDIHSKSMHSIEQRIMALEENIGQGQEMSSNERSGVKNELLGFLENLRNENQNMYKESSKNSEKMLMDAMEGLRDYLGESLSDKEFKMVYQLSPQKKSEKEEKQSGYSPQDVMSLLG